MVAPLGWAARAASCHSLFLLVSRRYFLDSQAEVLALREAKDDGLKAGGKGLRCHGARMTLGSRSLDSALAAQTTTLT